MSDDATTIRRPFGGYRLRELPRDVGRRIATVLFESDSIDAAGRQSFVENNLKEIEESVR